MRWREGRTFRKVIGAVLLILTVAIVPVVRADDKRDKRLTVEVIKPQIPLGIEGFFMRPARRSLYLMGTAISPFFGGWRLVGSGPRRFVVGADGVPVQYFPSRVQFRITAMAVDTPTLLVDRDMLDVSEEPNQFLLNLHFRLKVFRGLEVRNIVPDAVEMIGMPADVRYNERVYRLSYTLPAIPIEDRIVLEVLRPDDTRICKFHLEF
jgi:hypothetical protein